MPEDLNRIAPADQTFSNLLASEASRRKTDLVGATLQAFMEGDSNAIKLVTQALVDQQYTEDTQLIISDARFEEIITSIADHLRAA